MYALCTLHTDGKPFKYVTLELDYGTSYKAYQQFTSLEAFRKRGLLALLKNTRNTWCYVDTAPMLCFASEGAVIGNPVYDGAVVEKHCTSVWEFYAAIGYDYRKQRYLTQKELKEKETL